MRQVLSAGALGRPRGLGWGGRWEGGSGWGTYVNPWPIHANVWQKPLQYCKVISLQLIKINGKNKKVSLPFGANGLNERYCIQNVLLVDLTGLNDLGSGKKKTKNESMYNNKQCRRKMVPFMRWQYQ